MKNSKRIISILLALTMVLAFAACKDNDDGPNQGNVEGTGGNDPVKFEGSISFTLPEKEGTLKADVDVKDYFVSKTDELYAIINSADESDDTFIQICYNLGKTSDDLSAKYIDNKVGSFDNYEYPGAVTIGKDGALTAEYITASNSDQYVEAYLINVQNGTVGIIISCSSALKDSELSNLKNILNTLVIEK